MNKARTSFSKDRPQLLGPFIFVRPNGAAGETLESSSPKEKGWNGGFSRNPFDFLFSNFSPTREMPRVRQMLQVNRLQKGKRWSSYGIQSIDVQKSRVPGISITLRTRHRSQQRSQRHESSWHIFQSLRARHHMFSALTWYLPESFLERRLKTGRHSLHLIDMHTLKLNPHCM